MTSILEVKKAIEPALLENDDIMGVGLTPDRQYIVVYLRVPFDIGFNYTGGYPVIVSVLGQPAIHEVRPKDRVRPLIGSVSAGYETSATGTLSCVVYDKQTRAPLLMSNNHVFGNMSTESTPRATPGDVILQPGGHDHGGSNDIVATLERYVPWKEDEKLNIADVALASPLVDYTNGILCNGHVIEPTGVASVKKGERVYKVGRTTGLTEGVIKDIDFTVDVLSVEKPDGTPTYVRFTDQLLIDMVSDRGDSGSLILNANNEIVGLLFAGGKQWNGRSYVVANKIRNVMAVAGVDFT
jgi:hypothetical protein